jgi:hypothetical protein
MESDLFQLYVSYSTFGLSKPQVGSTNAVEMDNVRFAKMAKETIGLDQLITSTEVDIIFNKAKAKGARKLNYDGFKRALLLIALKRYPNEPDPFTALTMSMCAIKKNRAPEMNTNASAATKGNVYEKLTDTSLYTGSHKARFDKNGNGLGIEGRRDIPGTTLQPNALGQKTKMVHNSSKNSLERLAESEPNKKSSSHVFDRLTNTNGYTGSHKHRFNPDGTGRGLAGRDPTPLGRDPGTYRGGDVKELKQILRQ